MKLRTLAQRLMTACVVGVLALASSSRAQNTEQKQEPLRAPEKSTELGPEGRPVATLRLKDNTTVRGNATSYNGETQTLYFTTMDGRNLELNIDQLDARSVYLVNNGNVSKDNAQGQLLLGNFARDAGLWVHAMRHYEYAKKADPAMAPQVDKQIAILKQRAAQFGMDQANAAIERGDIEGASEWLTKIVQKLPDEPLAAEARKMLDQYYAQSHESRDDAVEASGGDLLTGELKRGKQYYDEMLERNKKGLTGKGGSAAIRDWEGAVSYGDRALKEIDKVAKSNKNPKVQETLDSYRKIVNDQIIEIRINVASYYMTRSSYNNALQEVNKALAIDKTNRDALAMRSRIENASSRGIFD